MNTTLQNSAVLVAASTTPSSCAAVRSNHSRVVCNGESLGGSAFTRLSWCLLAYLLAFGWVTLHSADAQEFEYSAPELEFVALTPSTLSARFAILQTDAPLLATQGFNMACAHDPTVLTAQTVSPVAALSSPDFFAAQTLGNGWVVGVVYSLGGVLSAELSFPIATDVIEVEYDAIAPLLGTTLASPLQFVDTLGAANVVINSVTAGSESFAPNFNSGSIELINPLFARGDCNSDDSVNVQDVVRLLTYLYLGDARPGCLAACDFNGNGIIGISDGFTLLRYLFVAGPALPEPFLACGELDTNLSCTTAPSCP